MRTLRELIAQLKRIADSLMMIEITLLKLNNMKYEDVQGYAKNYNGVSESVSETMSPKADAQ
ncbi:wyosine [tRNA(Phe)-imidazoG37] synthetase (radical SAM superfamily) [Rossellomorea marisflavi]